MLSKNRKSLFFLVMGGMLWMTSYAQKPTTFYKVTKLHGSAHYYYGYKTKGTVTNSKKNGIDTTYFTEFYGVYAISDQEAMNPILKVDSEDGNFLIDDKKHLILSSNKQKGVVNLETGKLIIPFTHNHIYYINEEDLIICQSKTEGNIHNRNGEKINTIAYKQIEFCSSGFYDNEQTGSNAKIYNSKNEVVIDFGSAKIVGEMYYENQYMLNKNGKYGIVNAKNQEVLPFVYSKIELTESEISEFYEATQLKNNLELKTIIRMQEDGNWKEMLPPDFSFITEIEVYNSSETPMTHPLKEAIYYGINSQNKGVFMDPSGKILLTLADAPKIYQASILEDKFLQAYVDYSDYSLLYTLENGKLILGDGYYYQGKLPAPFDNFLYFNKEGKSYGTSFVNSINYSTFFVSDYIYDFGLMKKDLQAIFTMGESTSHLLLFDIEKNVIRKSYSTKNYAEADYIWWEQYNYVVAQEDYSKKGSLLVYDLANDSMIYNGIQTPNAYKWVLSSLASQMDKELQTIQPLTQGLVNLPHIITTKNSETTFSSSYYDDDINFTIIPFLSKKIEFEWLDYGNVHAIGSTISLSSNMTGRTYTKTTVLDDHLNLIMPFQEGYVVNIIPNLQGSIIALQFEEDSVHYYNTATKKTLYFNSVYKSLKVKPITFYFYDWLPFANHVIIYEKDYSYIMDYNGKVLIKSKEINYANVGNNYYVENADGGTEVALLPSLVTLQVGDGPIYEYDRFPYVFLKTTNNVYRLYNAQTGEIVLNQDIDFFSTSIFNESIWMVNEEGKYASFNLRTNSLGKGFIYESEDDVLDAIYSE
jgi:hypothetical protein